MTRLQPSAVLVHGDTSSASMAALAAFYQQIPVGHVEAGLRTNDRYSPFPEEMNRSLIGRLSNWHYAPTKGSAEALYREGIAASDVLVAGNSVIDAAHLAAKMLDDGYAEPFVQEQDLERRTASRRLVLVTAHRRENWGAGLQEIASAVADMLDEQQDVFVVWPLHANPEVARTVRAVFEARNVDASRLVLCQALGYSALVWLLKKSWLVMTDSGGIQEEGAAFGTPVLVLRDNTERPELIEAGGGVLVGANRANIVEWSRRLHQDAQLLHRMRHIDNPFGNGTTGLQIRAHLEAALAS
jgi:UDP-N-acetylglucosamine 2-epimerase (non-hydrolysing)